MYYYVPIGGIVGVVTGDRIPHFNGYTVKITDSLEILSQKSPEAVKWWMEKSIFKQESIEERTFLFNQEACEIIS